MMLEPLLAALRRPPPPPAEPAGEEEEAGDRDHQQSMMNPPPLGLLMRAPITDCCLIYYCSRTLRKQAGADASARCGQLSKKKIELKSCMGRRRMTPNLFMIHKEERETEEAHNLRA